MGDFKINKDYIERNKNVTVDMNQFAEGWAKVDMYKAIYNCLPGDSPDSPEPSDEELAREFLKLWDKDSGKYSATLFFLAQKMLGEYEGSVFKK